VRAAQASVDQADANALSFDSSTLPFQSDGLHFAPASVNVEGDNFYQMYQGWAGGSTGGGSGGQVITSPGPSSTLTGGAGDDTIIASQGGDVLTGGAGADKFSFPGEPWSPDRITDFALGTDKLDLSALFQKAGYTGSNPVADHYITFLDDGAGGTKLLFDHDGTGPSPQWGNYVIQLDHVSAGGLTWAQLTTGGATAPPPSGGGGSPPPSDGGTAGRVLTSSKYGDSLTGGAGADTLNAGQGPDQLTGAGGADHFAFSKPPWNAGHITDFAPGVDLLDLRPLFAATGYSGSNPLADHWLEFRADGQGNTQAYVDTDGPSGSQWATLVTTLDHVLPAQISAGDWAFH